MAIEVLKSGDRKYVDEEWIKSYQTFSFESHDRPHRGFRCLRILNEDWIRPGTGFPVQSHQDIELSFIVMSGGLSHQDDLGNGSILRPGHIQVLSTGRGVVHSEYNASDKEETHLLRIGIIPIDRKLKPSYQEKFFSSALQQNQFCLVISSDGREGSLHIHQNINIYLALLEEGKGVHYQLASDRYGWIQLMEGEIEINGIKLEAGDGAAIAEVSDLDFMARHSAKFIFFDLN